MLSVTDKPILQISDDLLDSGKYAASLADFISKSDTPVTIGLQGEWGTGKTSLMNLIREKVNNMSIATSWVNTWEYALFKDPVEITPSILQGLLGNLKESCGENWTLADATKEKWKKAVRIVGALGNQILKNQTGVDVGEATQGMSEDKIVSLIATLKADIQDLISQLIKDPKNPYERVVFFVDDLDRINPVQAVEVLEALKNIFDLNHCVFVLAIDYDVVVKGLEGKFGKKTEENEREFRSFFDKIIQIPFTMPTSSYDIDSFLISKFSELHLSDIKENSSNYVRVVKNTVGYNPRSLKRFLNSFSLLNSLRRISGDENATSSFDNLSLFALLGIQISFPKIFRLIAQESDIISWDKSFGLKQNINLDDLTEKLKVFGDNEYVDEDWEKLIWGLCQSDSYLKSKAFNIIDLINGLRDHFGDDLGDQLEKAMVFACLTSVDDDHGLKEKISQKGNKTYLGGYEGTLRHYEDRPKDTLANWSELAKLLAEKEGKYKVNWTPSSVSVYCDGKNVSAYLQAPKKRKAVQELWLRLDYCRPELRQDIMNFNAKNNIEDGNLDHKKGFWISSQVIEPGNEASYQEFLKQLINKL